jgi:hypothetical protein
MARAVTATSTLILSRSDVVELLSLHECIEAVEHAFRLHSEGRTFGPGVLGIRAADGSFHIKAAGLMDERAYFAAKTNANFPDNPRRFGLPTIQGAVLLADASTGEPLAVMDSASVTALRTGAATAVAAKFLARREARTRRSSAVAPRARSSSRRSPRSCPCSTSGCSTPTRRGRRAWPLERRRTWASASKL